MKKEIKFLSKEENRVFYICINQRYAVTIVKKYFQKNLQLSRAYCTFPYIWLFEVKNTEKHDARQKCLSFFPVARVYRARADEGISFLTTLPAVSRKPNRVFPRCPLRCRLRAPPPESPGKREQHACICVYTLSGITGRANRSRHPKHCNATCHSGNAASATMPRT